MINSFKKYPALYNNKPKMDSTYKIPNKYFSIYQMTGNLVLNKVITPVSPKTMFKLYTINGTVDVELMITPKIDYNLSYLNLAINGDYKNITFVAKSSKTFRIKMYDSPEYYMLSIFENSQGGVETIIQQILLSKSSYSLTYMMPFNLE